MPSVYLEDHEVVDLILERPHLITIALAKLQDELNEAYEDRNQMWKTFGEQRAKIKELEEQLRGPTDKDK